MKYILLTLITFLLFCYAARSQTIRGTVTGVENEQTVPLVGAYVIWKGTGHGAITDADGNFELDTDASTTVLVANYVGYVADTVDVAGESTHNFVLNSITMEDVDVRARRVGSSLNRRAAMVTVDISSAELCKAACCNLGESFETNASVDVTYADAATGARTIQMLGLSGRYVQMLTENVPNLRGIASPFGLSYVPGPWMDGIQVSKGVGTVVNGYEAFTGQINIEFKKPVNDEIVSANIFGSSSGRLEANAFTALRVAPKLTTAFIVNYAQDFVTMDENDDDFRDEPQTRQINLLNRWNYHTDGYTWQLVVKTLNERRIGGHVDFDDDKPSETLYGVYINTDRVESWMKNGFIFSDQANLGIATGYIYHNQKSFFGHKSYSGTQHSYNINAIFNATSTDETHSLHAGISSQGDFYGERIVFAEDTERQHFSLDDYSIGAFGQYTLKLDEYLTIIAGLRVDWNNNYDAFVTPRLHVRFAPCEKTILRLAAGKGYRTASLFAENNYMLSSAREWQFDEHYGRETAWNFGINVTQYINLWDNELMLNAEYYRTEFGDQMVTDMDISPRVLKAYFSTSRSYADNVQIEGKYTLFRGFDITAAWRWNEAKQTLGGRRRQRPLVSRYKGLVTLSYVTPLKTWQFDANVQFNGSGRIPTTEGNPEEYLRDTEFDGYQMYNAQITKWFRHWSIYAGVENIGNFMQDDPIIAGNDPYGTYFDGSMIWGPLMSRKFYVGLRWSLERDY